MSVYCVGLMHVPVGQWGQFPKGRTSELFPTLVTAGHVLDAAQPVYTRLLAMRDKCEMAAYLLVSLERHLTQMPSLHRIILGFCFILHFVIF